MGEGPDSWTVKTFNCHRCKKITPHKPRFFEWGPAWMKCIFCGDTNMFAKYNKTHSQINFRIFLTKKQWENFDIREYIKNER
jgi:hypothetical protein